MGGRKLQRKPVVFVVDDEPVICQTIAIILNENDYDAIAFDDPLKAIEASEQTTPELLISDVMMPEMTGVELAIRLRQHHPECKVLLFSGQADTFDLLVRALAEGYDFDLLTKPVHPTDLLSKLQTM
jgi:CheY-like chemotaxis protein